MVGATAAPFSMHLAFPLNLPFELRQNKMPQVDLCHLKFALSKTSFPHGSDGKESACNVGNLGSISGLRRSPGGGHGNSLQYSCLENPYGQRSLMDYSPWNHKESDMTE